MQAEGSPLTYDDVGATLSGSLPSGFRHDRYEVELPDRPDAFGRAVEGIRLWQPHRRAGFTVEPTEPPRRGATVAVAAPTGPLTAVAVCRIVAVVDEPDRYGFAYGTLQGHPETGEEAFIVERRNGKTVFEITVFSKPAELLARAGGPVTRRIQRNASHRYLDGLVAFVAESRGWPTQWEALHSGASCPMCTDTGADEKPHGVRVFDGRWCDAYLGRHPVRPGYVYVIWKGRHVAEPTELSPEETNGFWTEVSRVAAAVERRYQPVKMNWMSLGNSVPHLHVHLVPRYADDAYAGGPIESDAFDRARDHSLDDETLRIEAGALRSLLE
jgi:uncharacterized protein (UPF0548 family)/diadenosine tetraphosphate (Ap4A) HIT family hydrolase